MVFNNYRNILFFRFYCSFSFILIPFILYMDFPQKINEKMEIHESKMHKSKKAANMNI